MLTPDIDNWIYGPPIKITSPDQFVPLYLAYQSPVLYKEEAAGIPFPVPQGSGQLDKQKIKRILLDQLNHPYPKQYSLLVNKNNLLHHPTDTPEKNTLGTAAYFYNTTLVRKGNYVVIVLPGFLGVVRHVDGLSSLSSERYEGVMLYNNTFRNIRPYLLILVKAKYIPYLRARLMLKLPMELPLGSVRVLQSSFSYYSHANFDRSQLDNFLYQYAVQVEHVTEAVMQDYVIGPPTNKTKEAVLKHAKICVEHPELMEPMNV